MIDLNAIRDTDQNFCRVFRLPETYPRDYCFGGGHAVPFQMVDWFQPIPPSRTGHSVETWGECKAALIDFLSVKSYVQSGRLYLVLTDFGEAFVFEGQK